MPWKRSGPNIMLLPMPIPMPMLVLMLFILILILLLHLLLLLQVLRSLDPWPSEPDPAMAELTRLLEACCEDEVTCQSPSCLFLTNHF